METSYDKEATGSLRRRDSWDSEQLPRDLMANYIRIQSSPSRQCTVFSFQRGTGFCLSTEMSSQPHLPRTHLSHCLSLAQLVIVLLSTPQSRLL